METTTVDTISTVGLTDAEVLAALYNSARAQGMGWLHFDPTPMTPEQADQEIEAIRRHATYPKGVYFDYLHGRVIKTAIRGGDEIRVSLYDRDNGEGAAARAIEEARRNKTSR